MVMPVWLPSTANKAALAKAVFGHHVSAEG